LGVNRRQALIIGVLAPWLREPRPGSGSYTLGSPPVPEGVAPNQPMYGWADVVGALPELLETELGAAGLIGPEACSPGRSPMGKRPAEPVQSQEEGMGTLSSREDREVWGPAPQRG